MFNRNVMVAHQLFIFSPAASLLLLYLPLKIHFEASLLELVITLGPPPHQLQARSHRERLSSFASFLSSSTRRNDKHLLSGGPPPTPTPPPLLCPPRLLCQSSTYVSATHPQAGACMQFGIVGMHVHGDGASPGTRRCPSLLREPPKRSRGHYCT